MSTKRNYSKYRRLYSLAFDDAVSGNLDSPLLPYLGIYLRDLIFMQDGNRSGEGEKRSYDKIRLIGGILLELKKLQEQDTTILEENEHPVLRNLLTNLVVVNQFK